MAFMVPPLEFTYWQLFLRWTFYTFLQVDHLNSPQPTARSLGWTLPCGESDWQANYRGRRIGFLSFKVRMSLLGMRYAYRYPWTLGDVMTHHTSLGNDKERSMVLLVSVSTFQRFFPRSMANRKLPPNYVWVIYDLLSPGDGSPPKRHGNSWRIPLHLRPERDGHAAKLREHCSALDGNVGQR